MNKLYRPAFSQSGTPNQQLANHIAQKRKDAGLDKPARRRCMWNKYAVDEQKNSAWQRYTGGTFRDYINLIEHFVQFNFT